MGENKVVQRTIHFSIRRGEEQYFAECLEFPIVTQAPSLDQLVLNIEESTTLFLAGEDLNELGLAPNPVLIATMELASAA